MSITYYNATLGAFALAVLSGTAQAAMIDDARSGAASYWGSNAHGYGDVIAAAGNTTFDTHGADVIRTPTQLQIKIHTNFAGHAGVYSGAAANGIGYGDLFLAPSWHPFGADAHHASDRAANGTVWSYGLNLDDRWNNSGGSFTIYKMNGAGNIGNVLLAESFITSGTYRNGQEVAVDTRSANVELVGSGSWTVGAGEIDFLFNLAGTDIAGWSDVAIHWGPTCQNDVIEGEAHVPEPASGALLALALAGLLRMRIGAKQKTTPSPAGAGEGWGEGGLNLSPSPYPLPASGERGQKLPPQ